MEFFVPEVGGGGRMSAEAAEEAWLACKRGAEGDTGSPATNRRIYRVRFSRGGKPVAATVGELDPYYEQERVMAIIEAGAVYKICCSVRGYLKVGDTPMVGRGDNVSIEEFAA